MGILEQIGLQSALSTLFWGAPVFIAGFSMDSPLNIFLCSSLILSFVSLMAYIKWRNKYIFSTLLIMITLLLTFII